jgi:ABC-type polysaccharide/polyol phosphate transport system ATPase subunit
MLLVSHEPRTIAAFCDRALLLEEGRILMRGPAAAVADRYLSLLTEHEADLAVPRSAGR